VEEEKQKRLFSTSFWQPDDDASVIGLALESEFT
jgi:hypothetical protein